ncbi:MAG: tetratricopeptide repeat protein, partial [Pseudomonadota bacterium]
MRWRGHHILRSIVVVLALAVAGIANSQQQNPRDDPFLAMMGDLRLSAEANDAARFIDLLDRAFEVLIDDPRLSTMDRIQALGGIVALSQRVQDPDAYLRSETALLAYAEQALGTDHQITISARGRLVTALMVANRMRDAEAVAALGPTSSDGRSIFNALRGQRLMDEGRYQDAAEVFERELKEDIQRHGPNVPARAPLLMLLSEAYLGAGQPGLARDALAPAYQWSLAGHYDAETTAQIALSFGRALSGAEDHEQAKRVLSAALRQSEQELGQRHRTSLMLGLVYANAHGNAGEFWRFQELRLRHFGLARGAGLVPLEMATMLENHAELLGNLGQDAEAETVWRELIALSLTAPEIDPLVRARALQNLGTLALKTQSFDRARTYLAQASDLFETVLGAGDLQTLRAKSEFIKVPRANPAFSAQEIALYERLFTQEAGSSLESSEVDQAFSQDGHNVLRRLQSGERVYEQRVTDAEMDILFALAEAEAEADPALTLTALLARIDLARHLTAAARLEEALTQTDIARRALEAAPDETTLLGAESLFVTRARILNALGRHADALADLETAVTFAEKARRWIDGSGAAPFDTVRPDLFGGSGWILADAAWRFSDIKNVAEPGSLMAQAFEAVQVAGLGDASRALARSQARFLRQDPDIAPVIADYEKAILAAAQTQARLVQNPDAAMFASLGQGAGLDDADARLRAVAPDYFDHLNPSAVGVDAVQDILLPDEALVLIAPASGEGLDGHDPHGLVFAITRDASAWARIPLSTRELAIAISRLHRQLDQREPYRTAGLLRAPVDPNASPAASAQVLFD